MYCSQCGKKIMDNANFCKYCGQPSNSEIPETKKTDITVDKAMSNDTLVLTNKSVYLLMMIVSSMFTAAGGLLPTISVGMWGYSRECSVKDVWELLSSLKDMGVDVDSFYLVFGLSSILYITSALAGIMVIGALISGKKKYDLVNPVLVGAWTCILADGITIIWKMIINHNTSDELYGIKIFSTPIMGWLLLIVPLVNIYIFVKGYLGEKIIYDSGAITTEQTNREITEEKVCMVCKTRYTLGSRCPKCGSTAVEH